MLQSHSVEIPNNKKLRNGCIIGFNQCNPFAIPVQTPFTYGDIPTKLYWKIIARRKGEFFASEFFASGLKQ